LPAPDVPRRATISPASMVNEVGASSCSRLPVFLFFTKKVRLRASMVKPKSWCLASAPLSSSSNWKLPSPIRCPGATRVGLLIRLPSTNVPLREPRSSTTSPPGALLIRACRQEIIG